MARLWIETDAGRAEYTHERRPMEPERCKAVCLIVGFTVYAAMVRRGLAVRLLGAAVALGLYRGLGARADTERVRECMADCFFYNKIKIVDTFC